MWCVRRWPSPPSGRRSSQGPAEVLLLPASPGGRVLREPRLSWPAAAAVAASASSTLCPPPPPGGHVKSKPLEAQRRRQGKGSQVPAMAAAACFCSPRDSGTSHSRPARSGCRAWLCSPVWLAPVPQAPRPTPRPPPPALHPENFQKGSKAFRPVGEMLGGAFCVWHQKKHNGNIRKLNDCQCHGPRGSDLHTLWVSLRLCPPDSRVFEVFRRSLFLLLRVEESASVL